MKKITKRVATYMLAIAGLTTASTSCNEENEGIYPCNKLVKIKNRLKILVLLPILALLPAMLNAQMGGTFTTTSSISTTCTISYAGLGQYVVPVKSMALNKDTVISVFYDNSLYSSYIQRTVNGTTVTKVVSIPNLIIEDFDMDTAHNRIYFCGRNLNTDHGFIATKNLSQLFSITNQIYICEDTLSKRIKRLDAYNTFIGGATVAAITDDNRYLNIHVTDVMNTVTPPKGWSMAMPDPAYVLVDVKHTKNYIVILATKKYGKEFILFRHTKTLPSVNQVPLPMASAQYCNYTVNPSLISYGEGYNCKIVTLGNTDNIMIGMSSKGTLSYALFGVFNMSDFTVTRQYELELSDSARPDIYDLEYNAYNGKVLCLMFSIDYDGEVIYEINPNASSSYTTNVVYPNNTGSSYNIKNLLRDITIYDSKYYLAFGRNSSNKIVFFDKKFNSFGGDCHNSFQATINSSTRITKGSQLSCLLWSTSPIPRSITNINYQNKLKKSICK